MSHRNARLSQTGRRIIIQRVLAVRPVAHVAKEVGISRTCAHRWLSRYRTHGWEGLKDRSSRPDFLPSRNPLRRSPKMSWPCEWSTGKARWLWRGGPASARGPCLSRILARAGMPMLWDLDPLTGERIRSSRTTDRRYERDAPGEMIHVDVKKLGRIPEGGGWRADPAQCPANNRPSHWTGFRLRPRRRR